MWRLIPAIALIPAAVSCGIHSSPSADRRAEWSPAVAQAGLASADSQDWNRAGPSGGEAGGYEIALTAQAPSRENTVIQPTAGRQVIYRSSINLHVKSFDETDRKITSLVNDAGGYIAQFSEDRSYGAQRGGRWTVRMPAAKFFAFLDSVSQLGVAERRDVQSQDVTEEFVDLEARLKNKQALEARLLE